MNPWPFVAAAYAISLTGMAWLLVDSFLSMRRAESQADKLRGDDL